MRTALSDEMMEAARRDDLRWFPIFVPCGAPTLTGEMQTGVGAAPRVTFRGRGHVMSRESNPEVPKERAVVCHLSYLDC